MSSEEEILTAHHAFLEQNAYADDKDKIDADDRVIDWAYTVLHSGQLLRLRSRKRFSKKTIQQKTIQQKTIQQKTIQQKTIQQKTI
jgi:hypothetical protein